MPKRITVPEEHEALIINIDLYQELLSLLSMVRRAKKRLEITEPMRAVASDLILAAIDTVPHEQFVERITRDRTDAEG